ncbi:MAG: hypothetical protein BWY79_01081 [Actinobacteria bacterium ADurb.Bin444]|nr:MAG: hypothetical protein BWY79_01081 [Actinobacteria bacterium ADurb.Bin444]
MRFVAIAQTLEDGDGLLNRRLFDQDLLKSPFQGRVLGQVLAVLVECGGADGLQFAPGQGRFQDGGGIDGPFRSPGSHQIVDLVYEEDDVAALGYLLHHLLEALLELTAVLGTRHQSTQVKRVDLLVFESLGHFVVGDELSQPLHHCGLAHSRLAHQHWVVLRTTG